MTHDENSAVAAWNRRVPEPGTSVIRWVKYDGRPETLPEERRSVLFNGDSAYLCDGWWIATVTYDDGRRTSIDKIHIGDIWAYLPDISEPPEENNEQK